MKDSLKEWGVGGFSGLTGGAFFLMSALTFGWASEISSFLTNLTSTTYAIGPFVLSQALIASIALLVVAGGANLFSFGANSEENHYASIGLIAIFLLMGLPSFNSWVASNTGVSFLAFLATVAGYSVIGGLGIGSEESDSLLSAGTSKLTGGRL